MCFKVKTPSVSARELTPSTEAAEPEAPVFGGDDDSATLAKGKKALKINLDNSSSISRSSGLNF